MMPSAVNWINRLMIIDWVRDTINAPQKNWDHRNWYSVLLILISNVAGGRRLIGSPKAKIRVSKAYMGLYTVGAVQGTFSGIAGAGLQTQLAIKEAPVYACPVGKWYHFDSGGYSSIKQTAFMDH